MKSLVTIKKFNVYYYYWIASKNKGGGEINSLVDLTNRAS